MTISIWNSNVFEDVHDFSAAKNDVFRRLNGFAFVALHLDKCPTTNFDVGIGGAHDLGSRHGFAKAVGVCGSVSEMLGVTLTTMD